MKIRCGTFNLYQFAEPPYAWYEPENVYSEMDWLQKKTWIKEQITIMECDVIGFQEVFSPIALRDLLKENGFNFFETVEAPLTDHENSLIFIKPVVAIASKYPIKLVEPVKVYPVITNKLPIKDFNFSRIPIKATIHIDGYGEVFFYVSHLKSKSPLIEPLNSNPSDNWDRRILETLRTRSKGHIASLVQRGTEATVLYHEITETISNKEVPIILLGDLNDDQYSPSLEALTNREQIFEVNGIVYSDLPEEAKELIYKYRLYDAFDLSANPSGQRRSPTHYYRGVGSVLDYIILSNMFNEKNRHNIGRVSSFEVLDQHLKIDGIGNHKQSDHAQVIATIEFK